MIDRYLEVRVLRSPNESTLNGVTSDGSRLFVEMSDGNYTRGDIISMINAGEKADILVEIPKSFEACPVRFAPMLLEDELLGLPSRRENRMAGGNYVMGDSRFARVYKNPISVHDRFEPWRP